MFCHWCGVDFEPTQREQKFCSARHAKSMSAHRAKLIDKGLTVCPKPYKDAYGYRGLAIREAFKRGHYFYLCECGAYHRTSNGAISYRNEITIAFDKLKESVHV